MSDRKLKAIKYFGACMAIMYLIGVVVLAVKDGRGDDYTLRCRAKGGSVIYGHCWKSIEVD